MLAIQIAAAIEAVRPSQLDHLAHRLWADHAYGLLADDDAQALAEAIHARRKAAQEPRQSASPRPADRASIFSPRALSRARQHPERIGRRRLLAATSPMPPAMAAAWTTGQLAVLRIVGDEVRDKGACDRSLAEIAARAGVCRSYAQGTIRQAARAGLVSIEERPQKGAKNLPNVLTIVSAEWATWLRRGPKGWRAGDGGIGSKSLAPKDKNLPIRRAFEPFEKPGIGFREGQRASRPLSG